jgi:HEAT repeat protein
VRGLALLTIPLVAAWLALLPVVRKRHLRALEASLSGRAAAFPTGHDLVLDSGSRAVLLRGLGSEDPLLVLHALERLAGEDTPALRAALRALAAHADAEVRERALVMLGGMRDEQALAAFGAALRDEAPPVRAAAAMALFALQGDDAVERVAPLLEDTSRTVRVTAAAGLISHGGIEGAVLGGGRLEGLLGAEDPKRRVEAAEILAMLGPPGFRPLKRLLLDGAPEVRKAALKSAPAVADRRLVPLLLEALDPPESRTRAAKALAAVGPPAVPGLVERLRDETAPRPVRLLVPRILKKIASPQAFAALEGLDRIRDGHVRLRVYSAAGLMRERLGMAPVPVQRVRRRIEEEVQEAYGLLASWEGAREAYGTPLLEDTVEVSLRRCRRRILRLLELLHPRSETALVLRHLESPARSAMALETLDTLLEPGLKTLVIPLLEDLPAQKQLERAGGLVPRPQPPLLFLAARCAHPEPYCAFGALAAAATHRETGVLAEAKQALEHPDPLVREGGILAVIRLAPAEEARALLAPFANDPTPALSLPASRFLARLEAPMYSTVEKVLFLMSVPIFAKLPGEDLAPLAQAAQVESHHPGALIVKEGDVGDALYVVLRGRVRIEQGGRALATLGPKDTFGEMAVLDAEARSADAVALEETEVLKIGSEEFYEALHEQSEIAEGVIKVLCRRLREADAQLKGRT